MAAPTFDQEGQSPIGISFRVNILKELRAVPHIMAFALSPELWGVGVPRGDGAAVIQIPGFAGSTAYLPYRMADFALAQSGYQPRHCGIGININCPGISVQRICVAIDKASGDTQRQVHLIGHSLGSALAKVAALKRPGKVASLISVAGTVQGAHIHPLVHFAASWILPQECRNGCGCGFQENALGSLPADIAQLALYLPDDGVIEPNDCQSTEPWAINVAIKEGTHISLISQTDSFREMAFFLAEHPAKKLPVA